MWYKKSTTDLLQQKMMTPIRVRRTTAATTIPMMGPKPAPAIATTGNRQWIERHIKQLVQQLV